MGWIRFHHIRTKLIIRYWLLFLGVMTVSFFTSFMVLRNYISKSIDEALTLQVDLIENGISTAADASIKNFYRSMARSAHSIAQSCYDRYLNGELGEQEAQDLTWSFLENLRPGSSGYLTVIDEEGVFAYHPVSEYQGGDATQYSFYPPLIRSNELYFSYRWINPGETEEREKLSYSLFFAPWHWYISVTGYRDELISLINTDDFKDNILAIKFGESGYPIIISEDGTLLVHPEYEGVNMTGNEGPMGDVTRSTIKEKNGRMEYLWQNPGDEKLRKKISIFREVEPYGFIVAVTAYESEFLKPVEVLIQVFVLALLSTLIIIGLLTIRISRTITEPIIELKKKMDLAAEGDLTVRSEIYSNDEAGEIGRHFNHLIATLEVKHRELEEQLEVNTSITEQLRSSLEELQETQQKLIEEERFANMGRLLARMSHHLNTPLGTSVTTFSSLKNSILASPAIHETEEIRHMMDLLEKSLEKTTELIESFKLLNVSRADFIEMDVNDFLRILYIKKWSVRLPQGIRIRTSVPEEFRIFTNPELLLVILNQVTENSLMHSFKDLKEGEISISFCRDNGVIHLEYSDTGRGIPKENSSRIFEPFYSEDQNFQARGIGMNIIYNTVVGSLGGTIRYTGDLDTGMRYNITLPESNLP